jgi:HD-like signal output (HDOD) protein
MLNPNDFKQAIKSVDALGANPSVLAKVAAMAKDPNADLDTICALLRNDGPLVADVIRISNTPYYSPVTPHTNLNSAVMCIGMHEVIQVVNLSLSLKLFARNLGSYGISAYEYWSTSVSCALVMEALAKKTDLNSQDAFTLGILHAIGRVLINRIIDETGFSIYWNPPKLIEAWERETVGFDSAAAGAMLLEHWDFPPETCAIISAQFNPQSDAPPVSLFGLLQFTTRLLMLTGTDLSGTGWTLPESDPFVQATGLTTEDTVQLLAGCRETLKSIEESVGMDHP